MGHFLNSQWKHQLQEERKSWPGPSCIRSNAVFTLIAKQRTKFEATKNVISVENLLITIFGGNLG